MWLYVSQTKFLRWSRSIRITGSVVHAAARDRDLDKTRSISVKTSHSFGDVVTCLSGLRAYFKHPPLNWPSYPILFVDSPCDFRKI